jgi:hypothetical protein
MMKSKNYLKNIIALQSGTGGIKCNDVPWPYSVDVVEIKNVMFHDVLTDDHKYKKRLRFCSNVLQTFFTIILVM